MKWTCCLVLLAGLLFVGGVLSAENEDGTRAATLIKKQGEKAKELNPYKPNAAEKWLTRVEGWGLLSPAVRNFYPYLGSAYSGGGFAAGAGYRFNYGDNSFADIHGAWSVYNYKMADATLKFRDLAGGHLESSLNAHYVDADKVSYYGIGNDTMKDAQSAYSYSPISANLTETLWPARWLAGGGSIGYVRYNIGPGNKSGVPSIEKIYTVETAPGLGTDPEYTVAGAFAMIDWRQSPGYTTSGGYYRADWYDFMARGGLKQDFRRLDVEGRQFLPILRANQVIALRALASFTDIRDANEIPFFLLPKLGGGDELRGFSDFRFRDRYRMLLTAEYRWTPSKFMDMVLYYETGKVAAHRQDLDFNGLHDTVGIGVRFHTPTATPFRVELAHSKEGYRVIFSGGTAF